MRGDDRQQHDLFSYGSLEERVPADHPLRPIWAMVDEALPLEEVPKIKAAVLVHHASMDTRLIGGWPAYEAALKANGIQYSGYVYEGAQHGFHNDTTPRYDEAAAKLAWKRTLDTFNQYLRG